MWTCQYTVRNNIMYDKLSLLLKTPEIYERTKERFWDDEYISKQMLEAHLNPYIDTASRRLEVIEATVEWISSMLPKGASILDIGCGPGLYTKQFSERQFSVVGLDFSSRSITYAREHDNLSRYILQDYLTMDFDSEFDMITLIYFDYGALIPSERKELLPRIYKALKPGGFFLFDVYTPYKGKGQEDNLYWEYNVNGGFWSDKPHIHLGMELYFGTSAEGNRHIILEEGKTKCYNLWDCYFTKESLTEELKPFDFHAYGFFGDTTGQVLSKYAKSFCAIFKRI